jgi:hypothetical protein
MITICLDCLFCNLRLFVIIILVIESKGITVWFNLVEIVIEFSSIIIFLSCTKLNANDIPEANTNIPKSITIGSSNLKVKVLVLSIPENSEYAISIDKYIINACQ